ncbi:GGDEF domain-containing protein [Oceanospirillum sediminis]|uniref:diguanylate cyclase n=1 Tax=Oceanospirillum sediminis TaxID=2760088 RepID=A0A839IY18_9GAMM|nr:GGDEF domain-containing protein [Oceanospirillum sediminis]MBB1489277.1 GGDEF domain-containing protein [Oceanospirillum sediminis]
MNLSNRQRHEQRLRIRRLVISALSHGMLLIILGSALTLNLLNSISWEHYFLFIITAAVTQAGFWLIIHYDLNLKLDDPSMTLLQMSTAIIWFSLVISELPEVRGALLILYVMVMLFGIFQLSMLEFAFAGLLSLVCFGAVIIADISFRPEITSLKLSIMQWIILATAQTWIALFGSYVRKLSERLKRQRSVLKASNDKMVRTNEELEQAMLQLDEIAGTDELTGILNRRRFFQEAEARLHNIDNYQACALCMIDIDYFKGINDRYGHQCGDQVLEQFSRIASSCLRTTDLFGRYGGEEFILLLPHNNQESGIKVAERIRQSFSSHCFNELEQGLSFTLSAGITLHRWGEPLENTLKRADDALYRAKKGGRNQTVYISGARNQPA